MGRYTKYSGKVDNYVGEKINLIVDEIKKKIPGLYAIIVMGGFGRGEGAVEIVNKKPRMINDFDLYIITKKQISDDYLEKLAAKCSKKIGVGGIAHPEGFEKEYNFKDFFHIDIHCLPKGKLKYLPPTIRYYEMKHSAMVIYGDKKIVNELPKIKKIPKPEALRVIMNRMVLLLMASSPEFIKNPELMTKDQKGIMAYYTAKSYCTITEALLIFSNNFEPTYTARGKKLYEIYEDKFPTLAQQIPDLHKKVKQFTNYKFKPDPNKIDIVEEWEICRENLGIIFRYCLSHFLKKKMPRNWIRIRTILKKELFIPYFNPYASFVLGKLDNIFFRNIVNWAGQSYMSYKYLLKLNQEFKRFPYQFLSFKDPGVKIIYIAPLVLYSFNNKGKVNEEMVKEAWTELKSIYKMKGAVNWNNLKTHFMKAYRLYYLQKFV